MFIIGMKTNIHTRKRSHYISYTLRKIFLMYLKIGLDSLDRLTCWREISYFLRVKNLHDRRNFHNRSSHSAKYNYPISHHYLHFNAKPEYPEKMCIILCVKLGKVIKVPLKCLLIEKISCNIINSIAPEYIEYIFVDILNSNWRLFVNES